MITKDHVEESLSGIKPRGIFCLLHKFCIDLYVLLTIYPNSQS